jgi:hypothetical protein
LSRIWPQKIRSFNSAESKITFTQSPCCPWLFAEGCFGISRPRPIDHDLLFLPECTINAYGTDAEYHQALKPAFDALWNAAGRAFAQWFTGPGGLWVGP